MPLELPMIRNVAILASSNLVAQGLNLVAYPALTYLYAPEEFGVFGIITSMAMVVGVIVCARLDTLVQIEGRTAELHLIRLSLTLGLAASTLCGLVGHLAIVGDLVGVEAHGWAAVMLAATLALVALLNGFYAVVRQYQVKHNQYGRVAWSHLLRVAVATSCQVVLGLVTGSYLGLLAGFVVGMLLATAVVTPWSALPDPNWRESLMRGFDIARGHRPLIALDSLNILISTSSIPLQLILVTSLYGPVAVGLFVVATRLILVPVDVLGGAVSSVYFQRLSEAVRSGKPLWPLFVRSLALASGLVAVIAIAIVLLLQRFVVLLFPTDWVGVVPICVALIPTLIARMLVSGVGYTALSLRRPRLITGWNSFQIIALLAAFGITRWQALDLTVFLQISGALLLLGSVTYIVVLMLAIRGYEARGLS